MSDADRQPLRSVRPPRPRVLIAGGGVAAIEALLALRHLVGEQVSIQLLAPDHVFFHRPSSVARPFGLGGPAQLDLAALARDHKAQLWHARLEGVDPARRVALIAGGEAAPYDVLIVAVGTNQSPAVPGAITFAGPGQAAEVAALLDAVERGESRRLVFAVPAGATWSLPIYELAMMAAVDLRDRGARNATLSLVTPEDEPLRIFGAAAGAALREMLDARGVALLTNTRPLAVREGLLDVEPGPPLRADAVVSLPGTRRVPRSPACLPTRAASSPPTRTAGCPASQASTPRATPPASRSSRAASPPSRPTRPPRRSPPTSASGPDPPPFRPVMRGLLLTGGAPLYLRAQLARRERAHRRGRCAARCPAGRCGGHPARSPASIWRPISPPRAPSASPPSRCATVRPPRARARRAPRRGLPARVAAGRGGRAVGDYRQALHALDAAAALAGGVLPEEWTESRERWLRELAPQR